MRESRLRERTLAVAFALTANLAFAQQPGRAQLVAVTGCLSPDSGRDAWVLTNATEPVPAARPSEGDPAKWIDTLTVETAARQPSGTRTYMLMGVLEEFGISSHKGHKVLTQGLLVPASPAARVNVTSVRHVASSCR